MACGAAQSASAQQASPETQAVELDELAFDHEHAVWTRLLTRHVKGGTFDYAALKKDPADLETYLDQLRSVSADELAAWSEDQRFAFWINVYNAHTIEKIVRNYPLDSIKDLSRAFGLKSVFDDDFIRMPAHHPKGKNRNISLNQIENEILRVRFKDARLHAAINCASTSCPSLRGEAFVALRLDAQLGEQMRAFLQDTAKNRFDRSRNRLRLSKIFSWFESDFERDAGSIRDYIARFSPEADAEFIAGAEISHRDYDWSLNGVKRSE